MLITVLFFSQQAAAFPHSGPPDDPEPDTTEVSGERTSSKLKNIVTYSCRDSMYFDLENEKVYLWDSASVNYDETKLAAFFIIIDFKKNEVFARGRVDSAGKYVERPAFSDGKSPIDADSMKYNYDSRKGKIWQARTADGESIIAISEGKKDSSNTMYGYKGIFTTCNLEHPHYAIFARKLKVIPNDKVVTGPAYLSVAGIPTPLAIPFGFFPNKKGRASGILIPAPGESPTLGFFLKDGGYYWGISDKIDLALRGDIYSRGSWGAKLQSSYKFRYKSSGTLSARYSRFIEGDRELPTTVPRNDVFVTWIHTQDPKSNPTIRFAASVNAGSSSYNRLNANRANDYLSNNFNSNISWSKTWRVGTLAANMRHSQSTINRKMDFTMPQLAFTVNRFYPFRRKNSVGKSALEKIGISPTIDFQNLLSVADTSLFEKSTLDKIRNGIRASIPLTTSFTPIFFKNHKQNWLNFFTFTLSGNINSVTQFKTIQKSFLPLGTIYNSHPLEDDTIIIDTLNGLKSFYEYNLGASMSTKYYFTVQYDKSRINAIRQTITPSVSFNFKPDFSDPKYGWYKSVPTNTVGGSQEYSIFEGGIYGSPNGSRTGLIGFQLLNSIEAKIKQKKDTGDVINRVTIIDAFNISTGYNIMADHFNWQNIVFTGRSQLFKKVNLNAACGLDPYRIDSTGKRIERYEWTANKRIGRLTSASINVGTSLRKGGFTSQPNKKDDRLTASELEYLNSHPDAYIDFNVPWSLNVNYTLSYSKPGIVEAVTQTIHLSGDLNVTPRWKIGFDTNYDIANEQFSYTSLNVYRDLHCWDMQFNWIPFGFRQSYNITIKVKSSVLQDLKLTRKRDWYDFAR